jgi:hypothetical protein
LGRCPPSSLLAVRQEAFAASSASWRHGALACVSARHIEVRELHAGRVEADFHLADRAVTLLRDDDFRDIVLFRTPGGGEGAGRDRCCAGFGREAGCGVVREGSRAGEAA